MSDIDRAIHTSEDLLSQIQSEDLIDMSTLGARGFPPDCVAGMSPIEYHINGAGKGGAGYVGRDVARELDIDLDAQNELTPQAPSPTQGFDVSSM